MKPITYECNAIFFPDPSHFQHLPTAGVLVLTGKATETPKPKPKSKIKLRLPNGKEFEGVFYKGTVLDITSKNVPKVKTELTVHFEEKKT